MNTCMRRQASYTYCHTQVNKMHTHINTNKWTLTPTQTLRQTYMTGSLQVSRWQLDCWGGCGCANQLQLSEIELRKRFCLLLIEKEQKGPRKLHHVCIHVLVYVNAKFPFASIVLYLIRFFCLFSGRFSCLNGNLDLDGKAWESFLYIVWVILMHRH